jgi:hypothetical protein
VELTDEKSERSHRTPWLLWLAWVLANALGAVLGLVIGFSLARVLSSLLINVTGWDSFQLATFTMFGLIIGLVQWFVLRF